MRSRRRISSGAPFEELASFSRAVVDGDMVYVSGTTGMERKTGAFPESAAAQARLAFAHIEAALREAGAGMAEVQRVVVYIADRADSMPVCETVGEVFAEIRPTNTTVISALALPAIKVDVTARVGSAGLGVDLARRTASGSTGNGLRSERLDSKADVLFFQVKTVTNRMVYLAHPSSE